MPDLSFTILGTKVPRMIGRVRVMQRLWNDLTKASPSHLSVVGPRYSGKTVLLHALADRMRQEDSPYRRVILWDLGHQTPDSNELFLSHTCKKIGDALRAIDAKQYSDHMELLACGEYGNLREVVNDLNDRNLNLLLLFDGFDKALGTGKLTRNLWDQLRELASSPCLRFVTATRRPLQELIRSEESVTSDFWNIFDMNPVRMEPFDENDRNAILAEVADITFHAAGKSELENWTGSYPPLYLAVVNQVIEMHPPSGADNTVINEAAKRALDGVSSILNDLWNDCPETAKDLYRHLVDHGEVLASGVAKGEQAHLAEKGFIKRSGNKITKACGLLEYHIRSLGGEAGSLMRLFGPWPDYRRNIRGLLQVRLNQLSRIDDRLRRLIERSIEDIPEYPHECLTNMRGIADRALDLIWEAEFGSGKLIPAGFIDYWETTLPRGPHNLHQFFHDCKVPSSRGHQCRLLQLLTGAAERIESKAKCASKSTYVLLNSIQAFGDFGQHLKNEDDIQEGIAVAAITCCLELAACLETDILRKS